MAHAIATSHPREMNRVEAKYERYLQERQMVGEIQWAIYEPLKLRLADKTYYSPDFLVLAKDGVLEAHEVKSLWSTGKPGFEEDARVKVKVAAEIAPYLRFIVATDSKDGWLFEQLLHNRELTFAPLVVIEDKLRSIKFDTEADACRAMDLMKFACKVLRG